MTEYIKREAVLNEQVEICHWDGLNDSYGDFVPVETVRSIPAADVVEVVRCKDCTYGHFVSHCSKYMCKKGCGTLKYSNDFCNYGKRNRN